MDPEKHSLSGCCSCGAISFTAIAPKTYGVCHCQMCRRWCGGVWMGVATTEAPKIEGPLKIWKSSNFAERAMCEQCGASIYYRPKGSDKPLMGQGLFNDQSGWKMTRQIFADKQPDHYAFGDGGPLMTGWGTFIAILFGRMPK